MNDGKLRSSGPVSGFGLMFAAFLVGAATIFIALVAAVFYIVPRSPRAGSYTDTIAAVTIGPGIIPLMLGLMLMLMVAMLVLLLVLVICSCGCKKGGGFPGLPGLPDLPGIGQILRDVALALKTLATSLETANAAIDPLRDQLKLVTSFTIPVMQYRSLGTVNLGFFQGEVWVPDHLANESPFDNATTQALNDFIGDVTGENVLDGAAGELRNKANVLEQQATLLDI